MITATEAKNLTQEALRNYTSDNLETIESLIRECAKEGKYMTSYTETISDVEKDILLHAGYTITTNRKNNPLWIMWD